MHLVRVLTKYFFRKKQWTLLPPIRAEALVLKEVRTVLSKASIFAWFSFRFGQLTGWQEHFTHFTNVASCALARKTILMCCLADYLPTAVVFTWLALEAIDELYFDTEWVSKSEGHSMWKLTIPLDTILQDWNVSLLAIFIIWMVRSCGQTSEWWTTTRLQ